MKPSSLSTQILQAANSDPTYCENTWRQRVSAVAFAVCLSVGAVAGAAPQSAWANVPAAEKAHTAPAEPIAPNDVQQAFAAASKVMQNGPVEVTVGEQAVLKLAKGFGFIPAEQARNLLTAMGNRPGGSVQGLIIPTLPSNDGQHDNWFVVVSFVAAGYIKDDDAKDWNADDLLKSLKEGADEANDERRSRGIPEVEVIGWVEKPHYDAQTHRLVWSVSSRDKLPAGTTATPAGDEGINYNTLALGREGYISMNLVTGLRSVETLKPTAQQLLASLQFSEGKAYGDFNASTDKVAEYGLAALIAGGAAKKLGLFAVIGAFLAKFAKVIGLAVIAFGAGVGKYFKGRKAG